MRYLPLFLILLGSLNISIPANAANICYQGKVLNGETQANRCDGEILGTVGQSSALESISISLPKPENGDTCQLTYRVHVENIGWMNWVNTSELAGTTDKGLRLEAFEAKIDNCPGNFRLRYRAHVQDIGWMDWVDTRQTAGTVGHSLRMEAIQITIEESISKYDYQGRSYPFYNVETGEVFLPLLEIYRNGKKGNIQTQLKPTQGLFNFNLDTSPSITARSPEAQQHAYDFTSPSLSENKEILQIPYLVVESNDDIDIFKVALKNNEDNKDIYQLTSIHHLPVPVPLDTFQSCFNLNLPSSAGIASSIYVRNQVSAYRLYETVTGKTPSDNNKGRAVMECCISLYYAIRRIPGFKHDYGQSCINR